MLSASLSPALGPCGIPLEPDALEPDDFDLVVVAGCELFEGVAVFAGEAVLVTAAGELFVEEEEELPELPQPAAMTPATARATNGSPRASVNLLIMANLCLCRESGLQEALLNEHDVARPRTFPAGVRGRFCTAGNVSVRVMT